MGPISPGEIGPAVSRVPQAVVLTKLGPLIDLIGPADPQPGPGDHRLLAVTRLERSRAEDSHADRKRRSDPRAHPRIAARRIHGLDIQSRRDPHPAAARDTSTWLGRAGAAVRGSARWFDV